MKAKLEAIRDKTGDLRRGIFPSVESVEQVIDEIAVLADTLLAELESEELVERVELEILGLSDVLPVTKLRRGHTIRNGDFGANHVAKAAINAIKGV